jgi:ADP-ribosylglycohydrolase
MLDRRERARLALEGLSVGDAFGERFFGLPERVVPLNEARAIAAPPWRYTDDTEMALSVVEQLEARERIDQDELAERFAQRMDMSRGYGHGAFEVLCAIRGGRHWHGASRSAFRGKGSFGNGAAMRVAPVGAWFADDLDRLVREAAASAEITHAHPEGIAGAIAVAVAAALCATSAEADPTRFLDAVLRHVPRGYTYDGIAEALALPDDCDAIAAAKTLGNGSGVTAPDTVPFCLWVVAHHVREGSYEEALWSTVSALGDRDTACAIVGGVIVLRTGLDSVPNAWRTSRESLPI